MADIEQLIVCFNCEGYGWRRIGDRGYYECPVCETRGRLVIDSEKTMTLPAKRKPRGGKAIKP